MKCPATLCGWQFRVLADSGVAAGRCASRIGASAEEMRSDRGFDNVNGVQRSLPEGGERERLCTRFVEADCWSDTCQSTPRSPDNATCQHLPCLDVDRSRKLIDACDAAARQCPTIR